MSCEADRGCGSPAAKGEKGMNIVDISLIIFASVGTATMLYMIIKVEQADDKTRKDKYWHGPKGQGR